MVADAFLRVWTFRCTNVITFKLNSNLTPFYYDLELRLKCQLIVCSFLIIIILTFDFYISLFNHIESH